MPRKPIIRSPHHFYHLTGRCNNKETFYAPQEVVWEVMTRNLQNLQKKYQLKIMGFVLMSNHFHLLMRSPVEDIDRVMFFFMKNVTREIQKETGRVNRIFGGRYKGCLIDNADYLFNVYKYLSRNPVAAGCCQLAQDYPFSSLYYLARKIEFSLELESLELVGLKLPYILAWINEDFRPVDQEMVKWGLSRTKFKKKSL